MLALHVGTQPVTLIAVPAIFEQLYEQGKRPGVDGTADDLLQFTRIYNPIPDAEANAFRSALEREFEAYCRKRGAEWRAPQPTIPQ